MAKWERSFAGLSIPRQRMTAGFPETLTTTLRYSDVYTLSTSGTAPVGNIFRMNSVFDPDFTGTGHQPLYFDQFAAVYSRYSVLGSKITATYSQSSSDTDLSPKGPYRIGITSNNDGSFASNAGTLIEQNKTAFAVLGRENGGSNVKTLTNTYSPFRDIGLTADDDTVGASVTTNPGTVYWAYVWCNDIGGFSGDVQVTVLIEFRVKFLRQNSIAGS